MPAPDPDGISIDEYGSVYIHWPIRVFNEKSTLGSNERRNRIKRVRRIIQNIQLNNWTCRRCGDEIGLHKRADAVYCSESCKKMDYRDRRLVLEGDGG